MRIVPTMIFLTKGVGVDVDQLVSFELALRKARIEICNLVRVSSIHPPGCRMITVKKGRGMIEAGMITHCVMSEAATNEPNRLIAAAIGVALPQNKDGYGYLSEHHCHGETAQRAGDKAEDMAAKMLATTLGIPFDVEKAWNERRQEFQARDEVFKTMNIVQSAEGDKHGRWTTVIAAAILLSE